MGMKMHGKEVLCVICLKTDKLFQYRSILKNVDETSNLLINDLIRKHTAVKPKLPLPTNFPEKICEECLHDLIAAHRISRKSLKAKSVYRKAQQEQKLLKLAESFSHANTLVQQDFSDLYVADGNLLVTSAGERNEIYRQQLENFLAATKKQAKRCHTPVACEICHRVFKSAQGVSCHKSRKHAELKLHSCTKGCGEKFSTKTDLLKHKCGSLLSGKRISTPVHCVVCNILLKGKTGIGSHMRTHPEHKPHLCTNGCGERFSTNIAYKKHKHDCPFRSKQ